MAVCYPDPAAGREAAGTPYDPAEDIAVSQIWPRTDEPSVFRQDGTITVVQQLHLGRGRVDDRELIRFIGASHALNMARKAALRIKEM